ncbi:MAG: hypothetical protein IKW83_07385 [Muribaculaceae bacterium]|nr:hypothetical protein [Muribaculaceae bacterium]
MNNTIVLQKELDEAAYQCRSALNKAQEAIYKLFKLADYPTPTKLEDVTTQRLATFVGERCAAVQKSPIHTKDQKDKIINDWIRWKVMAMPHVAAVENFVTEWSEVCPVLDTATMTILTSDINESLTPRFTADVPLPAHAHIALIHNVKQAITELREWEKEQDVKKVPFQELLNISEENLMQSWSNGSIKIDHAAEDERSRVWRESVYAATL